MIIKRTKLDVIVRICRNNASVELFCKGAELKSHWENLWCSFGVLLSSQQCLKQIVFHTHPLKDSLDLVRGAYFFHASLKIKIDKKTNFTYSEMECIKIAIEYGSVHAIQRFNDYLYNKLKSASEEEKDGLYIQIIKNSMGMFPGYGSYGYMVLAEALGGYALLLLEKQNTVKAKQIFEKGMLSLDKAVMILEDSEFSIHNASLGQGLKTSNSLGIETPENAKKVLKEKFEEFSTVLENRNRFLL